MPAMLGSPLPRWYRKWSSMLQRCYNPRHPAYKYYGGRGITVCDSWRNNPQAFLSDMGEPPEGLTLGRIDSSKGYEPSNCRWETWKEQCQNRRKVGPKPNPNSIRQKAIKAGLPYYVVYQRIKIHMWPSELALTTPVLPRGRIRSENRDLIQQLHLERSHQA